MRTDRHLDVLFRLSQLLYLAALCALAFFTIR